MYTCILMLVTIYECSFLCTHIITCTFNTEFVCVFLDTIKIKIKIKLVYRMVLEYVEHNALCHFPITQNCYKIPCVISRNLHFGTKIPHLTNCLSCNYKHAIRSFCSMLWEYPMRLSVSYVNNFGYISKCHMATCHWLRLEKKILCGTLKIHDFIMLVSKTDLNTVEAHSQIHILNKQTKNCTWYHFCIWTIQPHVTDLWVNVFEHSSMWRLKPKNHS